jgi:hypothetical protein
LGFGTFKIIQRDDIDVSKGGVHALLASQEGFEVQYTPSKGECSKSCEIVLVQSISCWDGGFGGFTTQMDASPEQIQQNKEEKQGLLPEMTTHGRSKYSYVDSPNKGYWWWITAAVFCEDPKTGKRKLLGTVYFKFNGDTRKVDIPGGTALKEGKYPAFTKPGATKNHGSHWDDAYKDWKKKAGTKK